MSYRPRPYWGQFPGCSSAGEERVSRARRRRARRPRGQFQPVAVPIDLHQHVRAGAPRWSRPHRARRRPPSSWLSSSGSNCTGSPRRRMVPVDAAGFGGDPVDDVDDAIQERRGRRRRPARPEPGSGCRTATRSGWSSSSSRRRSTCSLITCSQRQASSCTNAQSSPMTSDSRRSASRCLRITCMARVRPSGVQRQVAVALDVHQTVALHPPDRLRHGRARVPEALGDAGAQRDDALLLEVEDRPQIHLRRIDEIGHRVSQRSVQPDPAAYRRAAFASSLRACRCGPTRRSVRIVRRATLEIPADLLPADGRFGCGPSKVRPEQLAHLDRDTPSCSAPRTARRPSKTWSAACAPGSPSSSACPTATRSLLGNGGSTAFWDAAAFSPHRASQRAPDLRRVRRQVRPGRRARPSWRRRTSSPRPAARAARSRCVEGIDVYAWPHNETSTGVMAPVTRVHGDAGALTVIDATSAAGGVDFDVAETDVYYFAPQKNFASDGGLWFALVSPAAIERIERIAASRPLDPRVPEPQERGRQLASRADPQHAGHRDAAADGEPDRLDQRQRRARLGRCAHARSHRASCTTGPRRATVRDPVRRRTPPTARRWSSRSTSTTASMPPPSPTTLRANGIVDTEPYRKLGRNQLRVATFVGDRAGRRARPDRRDRSTSSSSATRRRSRMRFWLKGLGAPARSRADQDR